MDLTNPFRHRPRLLAQLPRIVRLYIANTGIGFLLAGVFTALVVGFNVANIGHLMATVDGGGLALFIFFFFNGIVFAGVQNAIVILTMPSDPE